MTPPTVGLADRDACLITLDRRKYAPGEACMVTLHEYGHLLELQHSPNPNDFMYPVIRPPRWPCRW